MQGTSYLFRGLISGMLLASGAIQAAEWSLQPGMVLTTAVNDNIRLVADGGQTVTELRARPMLKFGVARENMAFTGNAAATAHRFFGGSGIYGGDVLDREDYLLSTRASARTERSSMVLRAKYNRDDTLGSTLDETGEVDSTRGTRTKIELNPNWSRSLNERTTLKLDYLLASVDYQGEDTSDLVNYDYDILQASLSRTLTPRLIMQFSIGQNQYQPSTDADSKTLNLLGGFTFLATERLKLDVQAGLRDTTSDVIAADGYCVGAEPGSGFPECTGGNAVYVPGATTSSEVSDSAPVFSGSLSRSLEAGAVSIAAARSSYPGSKGNLLDTTRVILTVTRNLSETLEAGLTASYINSEAITLVATGTTITDQTLIRVTPKLTWQLQRDLSITGSYDYLSSDQQSGAAANSVKADRNTFYLTLDYQLPRISASR